MNKFEWMGAIDEMRQRTLLMPRVQPSKQKYRSHPRTLELIRFGAAALSSSWRARDIKLISVHTQTQNEANKERAPHKARRMQQDEWQTNYAGMTFGDK
jgi:hypothetical protein